MEICNYKVKRIDGDYAHLKKIDKPEDDLKLVARAILPAEIEEGSILKYECLEYTLM